MTWLLVVVVIVVALVAVGVTTRARRTRKPAGERPSIDPFAVGEPWRQYVQRAQRSERNLATIVDGLDAGPLRTQLLTIANRLDTGVEETWRIARRGDDIDAMVRQLDPTMLRARLDVARGGPGGDGTPDQQAIDAVQRQLDTVGRLEAKSAETARRLQMTQLRVEELVSRAAEVSVGTADTDRYASDVENLVVELETIRQAIDETDRL